MLIENSLSCLLPIDLQQRLLPAIAEAPRVVSNNIVLLKSAARLAIPVLASEQYPRGLGHTVPELMAVMPDNAVVEKMSFSCLKDPEYARRLSSISRPQVVVGGAETHVCVLQTVLLLRERGFDVFVVDDACGSRTSHNHQAGLRRMQTAGASIVTTEMVVFEWLGCAGTSEFRDLSALIK